MNKRKSKQRYQIMLAEYLKRKKEAKEKWGYGSIEYQKAYRKFDKRILTCRRGIQRAAKREEVINRAHTIVSEFIGVSPKDSLGNGSGPVADARNLFYKYLLENGIQASFISKFMGLKISQTPANQRLIFTRSFDRKPEKRALWHTFTRYVEDYE